MEYRSFVVIQGGTKAEAASDLGLSPRTLYEWAECSETGTLRAAARGRPLLDCGRMKRNEVIRYMKEVGPGVGVARIRGVFPEVSRCEVVDIVGHYREVYVRESMILVHELEWTMPGAVWAMDHVVPPSVIEGRYRAVLAVRDLGSGDQILWEPVESEGAREVVMALDVRFRIEGAPLVMKSDNGSGFIAEETQGVLAHHGVIQLLSPPALPQYNGSIEAGNGSMRARTDWKAALSGRHEEWTVEDLDAARNDANEMPRGLGVPAAGLPWRDRPAITPELRSEFGATVGEFEAQERVSYGLTPGAVVEPYVEAEIKRTAIRREDIQEEIDLLPLVDGLRPGWQSWDVSGRDGSIKYKQGPYANKISDKYFQRIICTGKNPVGGIYRKFYQITPGKNLKLTADVSLIKASSASSWYFSLQWAFIDGITADLGIDQMAGFSKLSDNTKSGTVMFLGGADTRADGKWSSTEAITTIPSGAKALFVWTTFSADEADNSSFEFGLDRIRIQEGN